MGEQTVPGSRGRVLYLSRSTSLLLSTSSRLRPSYPQSKQKCEIYRHCLSHLSAEQFSKVQFQDLQDLLVCAMRLPVRAMLMLLVVVLVGVLTGSTSANSDSDECWASTDKCATECATECSSRCNKPAEEGVKYDECRDDCLEGCERRCFSESCASACADAEDQTRPSLAEEL